MFSQFHNPGILEWNGKPWHSCKIFWESFWWPIPADINYLKILTSFFQSFVCLNKIRCEDTAWRTLQQYTNYKQFKLSSFTIHLPVCSSGRKVTNGWLWSLLLNLSLTSLNFLYLRWGLLPRNDSVLDVPAVQLYSHNSARRANYNRTTDSRRVQTVRVTAVFFNGIAYWPVQQHVTTVMMGGTMMHRDTLYSRP